MEPIIAFLAALVVGYFFARSDYSKPVQATTDRLINASFDYVGKLANSMRKTRPPS